MKQQKHRDDRHGVAHHLKQVPVAAAQTVGEGDEGEQGDGDPVQVGQRAGKQQTQKDAAHRKVRVIFP